MGFESNELSKDSKGGTELISMGIEQRISKELLDDFQIICSRVRELDPNKKRILWCHDLAQDPEAANALSDGKWNRFNKIVFVSNHQMQSYIDMYKIPYSKCLVLKNAITPIDGKIKRNVNDPIRLAYWSTPHRGLNILIPVFSKLAEKYDNIELHVHSSFNLYGWPQNDEPFKELFDACDNHPKIFNHGILSNEDLKVQIKTYDILAYPSTWIETSCMVLMEAMSSGLICVHPNLGALYETAANWTYMYQFHENMNEHANLFYNILDNIIPQIDNENIQERLLGQKSYTDVFYNMDFRAKEWEALLNSLKNDPILSVNSAGIFSYKVG